MIRILFFGATGKLGFNWINKLLSEHKNIIANVHKNFLFSKKNLIQKKIDIFDDQIINYCKKKKISIIINCVGLTDVDACQKNTKLAYHLNAEIPNRLCEISKKLNIRFIHISTDMLFNGLSKKKYSEKSKCNPINIYSKTKLDAENKVKSYSKTLIIRTNFFGFSNKKNMTFSDKILFEQKSKKTSYLWNNVIFTPIYINTLIFFIDLLIKKKKFGIYNVVSDDIVSKYDLGIKLCKDLFVKLKIKPTNFKKNKFVIRPQNMTLSNMKLKKLFPKEVEKLKLKNQIKEFIKHYKSLNYDKQS